jgi:ribose 5-phosphate isomerase A
VPFGWQVVFAAIARMEGKPTLRLSDRKEPYLTDEGNYILDCRFQDLSRPKPIAAWLDAMTGVVEHGLFLGLASVVIVGQGDDSDVLVRMIPPAGYPAR